jgi:hypothetical protein
VYSAIIFWVSVLFGCHPNEQNPQTMEIAFKISVKIPFRTWNDKKEHNLQHIIY